VIDTYKIRRPCLIGTATRDINELVPEAHLWRLVEGMVRGGRLVPVQVTEAEFAAAVDKYCPDVAAALYEKLGREPHEMPTTTRRGRPKGTRTVVTTAPVPMDADA
jgi:hypothetical protein